MIEPANPNEIPPGGWRWRHADTGQLLSGISFNELVVAARNFLGNNQLPIPRDLADQVLRWMDDDVQADMANRGLPPYPLVRTEEEPSPLQKARLFAHASLQWAKSGFRTVSQEIYEARMDQCRACQWWGGSSALLTIHCHKCGCTGVKVFWATSRCPDNPPRWEAVPG